MGPVSPLHSLAIGAAVPVPEMGAMRSGNDRLGTCFLERKNGRSCCRRRRWRFFGSCGGSCATHFSRRGRTIMILFFCLSPYLGSVFSIGPSEYENDSSICAQTTKNKNSNNCTPTYFFSFISRFSS